MPEFDPPPPSCLLLHGLGGGRYEFGRLVEVLESAGVRASAPTLPGHDGPGPIMPGSAWRDWSGSAESAFDDLAAEGRPVMVVGFSTGATLALGLAASRDVAGLVLLAPFLAIRFSGLIPIHPTSYLAPIARWMPNLPRRAAAVRDLEARRGLRSASNFRTFSLAATLSALELIDRVKPLVPSIKTPTLILQGRLDTVVEPSGAAWLERSLGSSRKSMVWLPGSDHLLALDRDRDVVIELTSRFVLDLGRAGAGAGDLPGSAP